MRIDIPPETLVPLLKRALLDKDVVNDLAEALADRLGRRENGGEGGEWLNQRQAQAYAGGVSLSTLQRMRARGLRFSNVQGRILYRKADLDAYLLGKSE